MTDMPRRAFASARVTRTFIIGLIAAAGLAAGDAAAQVRASERGGVFQIVDGTTIRLEYGRPQARGRVLFGDVLPWGKVWTGANWATTLEVDKDVTINGHPLAAGIYSVWLELQPEEWTAIFDPEPHRFHLMPPEPSDDQLRFMVEPGTGPHTEILTWTFPAVRQTGATLQLAWGETTATFDIGVQPSRAITTPEALAKNYVGSYLLTLGPQLGDRDVAFDIRYEDGLLIATWEGSPNELLAEPYLIHLGANMFIPGERDGEGELVDMLVDLVFEFDPFEGPATGFELRALGDEHWGTAVRR
jgi:hypothetical protein